MIKRKGALFHVHVMHNKIYKTLCFGCWTYTYPVESKSAESDYTPAIVIKDKDDLIKSPSLIGGYAPWSMTISIKYYPNIRGKGRKYVTNMLFENKRIGTLEILQHGEEYGNPLCDYRITQTHHYIINSSNKTYTFVVGVTDTNEIKGIRIVEGEYILPDVSVYKVIDNSSKVDKEEIIQYEESIDNVVFPYAYLLIVLSNENNKYIFTRLYSHLNDRKLNSGLEIKKIRDAYSNPFKQSCFGSKESYDDFVDKLAKL